MSESSFVGFDFGPCAACHGTLDGGYVSAPGGKYHAHCIGPTATGTLRLESQHHHLQRSEVEVLKRENAALRLMVARFREAYKDALVRLGDKGLSDLVINALIEKAVTDARGAP